MFEDSDNVQFCEVKRKWKRQNLHNWTRYETTTLGFPNFPISPQVYKILSKNAFKIKEFKSIENVIYDIQIYKHNR